MSGLIYSFGWGYKGSGRVIRRRRTDDDDGRRTTTDDGRTTTDDGRRTTTTDDGRRHDSFTISLYLLTKNQIQHRGHNSIANLLLPYENLEHRYLRK